MRSDLLNFQVIDSHIHIDQYGPHVRNKIIDELSLYNVESLIAVSNNLSSAQHVQQLAHTHTVIKPAYGFHPEQPLPTEQEISGLIHFIDKFEDEMVAIGEVGLPYYKRQENPTLTIVPYIELLEEFMKQAKTYDKPIVLHAIYEDASIVCDLLEKHSIKQAHFHWFKGDNQTMERMISNGYHISITPDLFYKKRTRKLIKMYPIHLMMVETDGPWQFQGPLKNFQTHPKMLHKLISEIARIKQCSEKELYETIHQTTKKFYRLPKKGMTTIPKV